MKKLALWLANKLESWATKLRTWQAEADHSWVNQGICCRLHGNEYDLMHTMIVCPECGDKRCPKADNCWNDCWRSGP